MYRKKRVAAYVRVSTSHEQQIDSLEAQTSYYKNLIHKNPNWSFVGIYIESGRSATNVEGRPVLRKLLADAHGGLVDLILIKSISRLSRNTVDLLTMLKIPIPQSLTRKPGNWCKRKLQPSTKGKLVHKWRTARQNESSKSHDGRYLMYHR